MRSETSLVCPGLYCRLPVMVDSPKCANPTFPYEDGEIRSKCVYISLCRTYDGSLKTSIDGDRMYGIVRRIWICGHGRYQKGFALCIKPFAITISTYASQRSEMLLEAKSPFCRLCIPLFGVPSSNAFVLDSSTDP